MQTIITFGTFDLFHHGHIHLLERAHTIGKKLIVGVSTDQLNFSKKQCYPKWDQEKRAAAIRSLSFVDEVFFEESLEAKLEYIKQYNANCLVMGDDWQDKFDYCKKLCDVHYFKRTANISSTLLRQHL